MSTTTRRFCDVTRGENPQTTVCGLFSFRPPQQLSCIPSSPNPRPDRESDFPHAAAIVAALKILDGKRLSSKLNAPIQPPLSWGDQAWGTRTILNPWITHNEFDRFPRLAPHEPPKYNVNGRQSTDLITSEAIKRKALVLRRTSVREFTGAHKSTGDVAQLGEHRLCKPGVEGSIPFVSTFTTSCRVLTYDYRPILGRAATTHFCTHFAMEWPP